MRLKLIWIGKTKNQHLALLEENYHKRIKRFMSCEKVFVIEEKKSDRHSLASGLAREASSIKSKLQKNSFSIALDESGVEMTSRELADLIQKMMVNGTQEVVFIGGGFHGMPPDIDVHLNMKLSLSQFTFPHELARVVLLEQIYRAFCLIRGMPYHK